MPSNGVLISSNKFGHGAKVAIRLLITIFVGLSLTGFFSVYPSRFCDLRAFYCAGRAVLAGRDPYREHPLHECEHALPTRFLSSLAEPVTIPAPYPGYDLALFAVIARLPFGWAVIAVTLGSCLTLGAATLLVARSTSTPLFASTIALGFPAFIVPLPLGQPTPFVLCAIAGCAQLLKADRPRLAALCAVLTAIEPHVGLAVWLGLFVGVPRARPILVAGALLLLAVSTLVLRPAQEWEYVHDVVPLQALVNVPEFSQLSTANLAYTAGLSPRLALRLGYIWYACSLLIGLAVGLRSRSRLGGAAVALVPAAFAVFGGPHIHLQQMAFAAPAFLLATSAATGVRRAVLVFATFFACVPWLIAAAFPYLFVPTAVLAVVFARVMRTARTGAGLGLSSFIVLGLLCSIVVHSHARPMSFESPAGNPLAEVGWGLFVDATSLPAQIWFLAGKIPTLLALMQRGPNPSYRQVPTHRLR
jgi:hypothetical protein